MKILALDTATALCGVAVLCEQSGRSAFRRQAVTTHSEMLLPLLQQCLDELNLRPAELDGVACGAGPGSFTGLRIGLATAKGLCFALDRPLVLPSSLEALALRGAATNATQPVLSVLDAFRGQVYARLVPPSFALAPSSALQAVLSAHPRLREDAIWNPQELATAVAPLAAELILVGDGLVRYSALFPPQLFSGRLGDEDRSPHPLDMARLGIARFAAGERALLHSAVPNYLCGSAAEEAWKA